MGCDKLGDLRGRRDGIVDELRERHDAADQADAFGFGGVHHAGLSEEVISIAFDLPT
jgi:hypothetical protein